MADHFAEKHADLAVARPEHEERARRRARALTDRLEAAVDDWCAKLEDGRAARAGRAAGGGAPAGTFAEAGGGPLLEAWALWRAWVHASRAVPGDLLAAYSRAEEEILMLTF